MNEDLEWKDGGAKPLPYAKTCAICGEQILVPTRDYYYARSGDKWVHAHARCVPAKAPSGAVDVSAVVEAINDTNEAIGALYELLKPLVVNANEMAIALGRIAEQGAKL